VAEGAPEMQESDLNFCPTKNRAKWKTLSKSCHRTCATCRVFLHLTATFEPVDDLFLQGCLQSADVSGGVEERACLVGELFAGVPSRVQNSHFISQTSLPVAQPDVLGSLCYKMLSN